MSGMAGFAGGVDLGDAQYVIVGVLFAVAGPTNFELSQVRARARPWTAFATAFALLLVTLRVGQGRGLEFIYFQF
jgi:hypothetical protein